MLPVNFALCSGSNPNSRSDGDGRSWDDAGLGLFSPKLGKVEFWAGAVGRVMVAPNSLEGAGVEPGPSLLSHPSC